MGRKKGVCKRRGDPRMNRALELREAEQSMSLLDALLGGGFVFPSLGKEENSKLVYDTEGVSLYQRRNQLLRRIRLAKQIKTIPGPGKDQNLPEAGGSSLLMEADSPKHSPNNERIEMCDATSNPEPSCMLSAEGDEDDTGTILLDAFSLVDTAFQEMIYPHDEKRERSLLSKGQRVEISNDLYGTTSNASACPPIGTNDLECFEEVLNGIRTADKCALEHAQRICPELVGNKQKEMFLRWAESDVEQAVTRFVTYWNYRQHFFGDQAFLPLTLDQLQEKDKATFQAGILNILPGKDTQGRTILWARPGVRDLERDKRESVIRCIWLVVHHALEDIIAQENGFIIIGYGPEVNPLEFDLGIEQMLWRSMRDCLPLKIRAMHFIRFPLLVNQVMPILKFLVGKKVRQRIQIHNGSDEEVLRSLSTFGIPTNVLPCEIGGETQLSVYNKECQGCEFSTFKEWN